MKAQILHLTTLLLLVLAISLFYRLMHNDTAFVLAITDDTPVHRLEGYPEASHTWGEVLNPSGDIPAQGYAAYYINSDQPHTVVARDLIPTIAIHYAHDRFHGIPSEKFGAYWAGRIHIPKKGRYRLRATDNHAEYRILLNRHIIIDSKPRDLDDSAPELDAGDYHLEIEYLNHWHTTNFQFIWQPLDAPYYADNDPALPAAIAALNPPANTAVHTVAVYEGGEPYNHVTVQAPTDNTPYILVVSSYNAVNWQLRGRAPLAVLKNGSIGTVSGVGDAPVFTWGGYVPYKIVDDPQNYTAMPSCECDRLREKVYCHDYNSFPDLIAHIERATGYPLASISTAYGGNLAIGQVQVTPKSHRLADRARDERDTAVRQCSAIKSRQLLKSIPLSLLEVFQDSCDRQSFHVLMSEY